MALHRLTRKRELARSTGKPPFYPWEMSDAIEVLSEPGGAKTMKITLTGRPGKVVDKGTYILTTMPAQKVPALPRGLPPLPADAVPPLLFL
jgi:hypothetical protein